MLGKMLRWILRCAQNDVQRFVLPLVTQDVRQFGVAGFAQDGGYVHGR